MKDTVKFDCGCEFETENGRIIFDPDVEKLNLECEGTWDLFCDGLVKGIFQLESQLGRSYAKKTKPKSIEELSDLLALIRPSCLQSGIADRYVKKKQGEESIEYYHESLIEILKSTLAENIYQEQSLQIVNKLAGFDLSQADILRRAIGHKEVSTMAKIRQEFLDGCEKIGVVNKKESEHLFDEIEAAQRYQFNKCLSLDTAVKTLDGYKTLEDVEIGDLVKTSGGFTEVVNKYDNGTQELFEITIESGKNIKCTLNHQFMCEDEKKHPLWEILQEDLAIVVENGV